MAIKKGGSKKVGSIPASSYGSPRDPSGRDPLTNPNPLPTPGPGDRTNAEPFVTPTGKTKTRA